MVTSAQGRWSDTAKLAAWAMLMGPLTVFLHELGHLAVPALSGLPAELRPMSVGGGAKQGEASTALVALQSGGGPLVTLAMGLVGARLYAGDRARLWALALAVAAVSRMLVTSVYLGVRLGLIVAGQTYAGQPNFDEHNVATALGVPTPIIASAATAFLFGLLYWLLRRVPRGRRILFSLALIGGLTAGLSLWATIMPPVLLTLPGR